MSKFFFLLLSLLSMPAFLVAQMQHWEVRWFPLRLQLMDRYETFSVNDPNYAVVSRAGRFGLVDRTGKEVVPLTYTRYYVNSANLLDGDRQALVLPDGTVREISGYGLVNYDRVTGLLLAEKNGRSGWLYPDGHWVPDVALKKQGQKGSFFIATDSTGQYGVVDHGGKWLPFPGCSILQWLPHGWIRGQNDQSGAALFDTLGRPHTGFLFQNIVPLSDGSFWANTSAQTAVYQHYSNEGDLLSDPPCRRITAVADGLAYKVLSEAGQYLFWDAAGKRILSEASWQFEAVQPLNRWEYRAHIPQYAIQFYQNDQYGIYLPGKKAVITAQYDQFLFGANQIIGIRSGYSDWYDPAGRLLKSTADSLVGGVHFQNNWTSYTSDRYWVVQKNRQQGILDSVGAVVIPIQYESIQLVGSGCYVAYQSGGRRIPHLLGPEGQEILPAGYAFEKIAGNYAVVRKAQLYGLAGLDGRIRIEPKYESLNSLDDYRFGFIDHGMAGVVDATGRVLIPAIYSRYGIQRRSGYFFLEKNGLHGIADLQGNIKAPVEFTQTVFFRDQIFLLKKRQAYHFLPDGTVAPTGWEWENDDGMISLKGKWGMIGASEKIVLPLEYDTIFWSNSYLVARRHGKPDAWYKQENDRLQPVPVSRIVEQFYWATIFERSGKQGMTFTKSHDSIPAEYDQIVPDRVRRQVMAFLNKGVCTVPRSDAQPNAYTFPADSLRSFYIADWLQYWHRGEAWVLNLATGAKRKIEILSNEPQVLGMLYHLTDTAIQYQSFPLYQIREHGEKRYALLDHSLRDLLPKGVSFDPEQIMYDATGKLLLRLTRNGKEGLWRVADSTLLFPYEYDHFKAVTWDTRKVSPSGNYYTASRPLDYVILQQNGQFGLRRMSDGRVLLPCRYQEIEVFPQSGLVSIQENDLYGAYRLSDGKMLAPAYGYMIASQYEDQLQYFSGKRWIFLQHPDAGQGVANRNLDIIVPPDHLEVKQIGAFFAARKDSLWGVYDTLGNLVIPYRFSALEPAEYNGSLLATEGEQDILLDADLQPLNQKYDGINQQSRYGLVQVWQKNRTGLLDTFGRDVLPAIFCQIYICDQGYIVLWDSSRRASVVRPDLTEVLPPDYENIQCMQDSNFMVRQNGKIGILRPGGRVILPLEYDLLEESPYPVRVFQWGIDDPELLKVPRTPTHLPLVVGKKDRYALMQRDGQLLTGYDYDYAEGFHAGRAAVRQNGRWGFLDSLGKVAIPLKYDFADAFDDQGFARVFTGGQMVRIDRDGKPVAAESTGYSSEQRRYQWGWETPIPGLKDNHGRVIIQNDSLAILSPKGSICSYTSVKPDGGPRYGLMDVTGKILSPRCFDDVYDNALFNEHEIIPVRRGNLWGYINQKGTMVIPFQYQKALPFSVEGKAVVQKNGQEFRINRQGACVEGCQ